jgi:hypothetical protein
VSLSNLLGVGVGEMSASQLEAAEDVHRDLLARLTDARVELARRQERARLEEAAAIERTIDQTLAAAWGETVRERGRVRYNDNRERSPSTRTTRERRGDHQARRCASNKRRIISTDRDESCAAIRHLATPGKT